VQAYLLAYCNMTGQPDHLVALLVVLLSLLASALAMAHTPARANLSTCQRLHSGLTSKRCCRLQRWFEVQRWFEFARFLNHVGSHSQFESVLRASAECGVCVAGAFCAPGISVTSVGSFQACCCLTKPWCDWQGVLCTPPSVEYS
jgi:hypothetical protein